MATINTATRKPRGEKVKSGNLKKMISLAVPYKKRFALAMLFVILAILAELAKPYVMEIVIDEFLTVGTAGSGVFSLTGLAVVYFLLVVIDALSSLLQVRVVTRTGQQIIHSMRQRVFSHVQHMTLSALDRYSSGRLITRVTNDVETLNEFYSDVLVNLFRDVFLLIGIIIAMLSMNTGLALVAFAVVPLIFILTFMIRTKLRNNFTRMKAIIGEINGFFAENMAGMRIVQAFNRQREKMREFRELNDRYFKTTMVQVVMNSILRPAMEVINSLAIALLIVYAYNRISGSLLEVGVLYAFTNYIKQFFNPINDLAENYTSVQSAMVSADRVYELLEDPAPLEDLEAGSYAEPVIGTVEFKNVWFAYEGEDWILRDVSFKVDMGQNVAFVGATGSGKTTIINLISRFYVPQRGEIYIDGIPIGDWKLGTLRRGIAVVMQDVVLFSGTIADNIRVNDNMGDEEVMEAIRLSMAEEFILSQRDGVHSEVTERGSTFSTGERQLLSFARAIAHKPSILVLDEATANIDTNTEAAIQKSIARISQNRTALFIAHRLSTIRSCDQIYVLRRGRIREQGTHEQLMEAQGLYYGLYQAQFLEQEGVRGS